jgi:hypothetical protein
MDTAEILVVAIGSVLIAFTLWFFFGNHEESLPVTADSRPLYECPMHPWITSSDPTANCSLCGMKLVRRGAAESQREALRQGQGTPPHH